MTPYYQDSAVQIFLGDAREILPQLPDASVDMIFTDPPYGHNNNNGDLIHNWEAALGRPPCCDASQLARPIANDGPEETAALVRWFFGDAKRLLRNGSCCCCCCGGGGPDPQFARWSLWLDEVLAFKQMVVWDKGLPALGWHYRRSYETVLVANKSGAACKWHANQEVAIENVIRNVKREFRPDHPNEKPVKLPKFFIDLHSLKGETVLDPFMGAGTTLVAAREIGRRAIGIELEEKYCAMAAERCRNASMVQTLF